MRSEEIHNYYLDELVRNLPQIDEDLTDISWLVTNPYWLKEEERDRKSLCDLIIVYQEGAIEGIPVEIRPASAHELKSSSKKRSKARSQLEMGRQFIEQELELKPIYGKFVTYGRGGYTYETYKFQER